MAATLASRLRSTLGLGLCGSLLFWAALPPLSLGFLGWIAPVPWLLLVQTERLSGRRPYRALWFAGFAFWLAAVHWLRLPHPATSLGWIALSAYLGCYLPVFVGLSRVGVHMLRLPLWLVAPVVWTGLELAQAHLLTGFLMGALEHTQAGWLAVIQISDLAGSYAVSFLMMAVSSAAVVWIPRRWLEASSGETRQSADKAGGDAELSAESRAAGNVRVVVATAWAASLLTGALVYGHWRLRQDAVLRAEARIARISGVPSEILGPRIALVQGNVLAEWKRDEAFQQQIMEEYIGLSRNAVGSRQNPMGGRSVDLVIWPETMFRTALFTYDEGYTMPAEAGMTAEERSRFALGQLADLARNLGVSVLVGVDRVHGAAPPAEDQTNAAPASTPTYRFYNSAVLVDRFGATVATYDKVHRVMFGEYVPLPDWLPFVAQIKPLTGGIDAGEHPLGMNLGDIVIAPNICYETVIPHVIRRQVSELTAAGTPPDLLVNLTNDAWYWGSSELDMHLACGVFRAIENRTPLVIAANGGISASIDGNGRVVGRLPRQTADVLISEVILDPRRSPYSVIGDWFAGVCLAGCAVLAAAGVWPRRRTTRP